MPIQPDDSLERVFRVAVRLPHQQRQAFIEASSLSSEQRDELQTLIDLDSKNFPTGEGLGRFLVGNRYLVVDEGREGQFAVVYRALDLDDEDCEVAIKLYSSDSATDQRAFQAEYRCLVSLRVNGAVAYRNEGRFDGRPYLVLEWLPDAWEDTAPQLRQQRREMERVLLSLAETIDEIHRKDFLHLDIKAGNVRFRRTGEVLTPVLIDFNISRAIGQDSKVSAPRGTEGSAAIEQYLGRADRTSDIFAFAVLVVGTITGSTFEPDLAAKETPWTQARRSLKEAGVELGWRGRRILARCLAENSRDRATHAVPLARAMQTKRLYTAAGLLMAGGMILGLLTWFFWPIPSPEPQEEPLARIEWTAEGRLQASANAALRIQFFSSAEGHFWGGLRSAPLDLQPGEQVFEEMPQNAGLQTCVLVTRKGEGPLVINGKANSKLEASAMDLALRGYVHQLLRLRAGGSVTQSSVWCISAID